jgi:ribosome-associated protein
MDKAFMDIENKLADANPLEIAKFAVQVLDNKKAGDIKLLKVDGKTVITDYFVIATGNSSTQVKSLADEVEYRLHVAGLNDVRLEGTLSNEWKILDCHDVIIHIFSNEARNFYKLEKLWADAEDIDINDIINND